MERDLGKWTVESNNNEDEIIKFYCPFFPNVSDAVSFLQRVYEYDWDNYIPRKMMNQVQRFVTLAEDIDKIRPGKDGLRIIFFKTCLDTLSFLSRNKGKEFYSIFERCFSSEGIRYILSHFILSDIDLNLDEELSSDRLFLASYDISIGEFLNIIKATRNIVVHQGIYWEMQFFTYDDNGSVWLTCLQTDEKILDHYDYSEKREMLYGFHSSLDFDRFKYYFVEACLNYIIQYIEKLNRK